MIAIRVIVRQGTGIGHLSRMTHVGRELVDLGEEVLFVLDTPDSALAPFLDGFTSRYLYDADEVNGPTDTPLGTTHLTQADEVSDAEALINLISEHPVNTVIVDSYLLGKSWETRVRNAGYRLAVIDDLGDRTHDCDILVDQKWAGPLDTPLRYLHSVPENCVRLLGPNYCMLGKEYQNQPPERSPDPGATANSATLMLSLGGGGDLRILRHLIEQVLAQPAATHLKSILVVAGPKAQHRECLDQLAESHTQINIIDDATSLRPYYVESDLFVGALGTALYELASVRLPALTFSIAENQENDIRMLEQLGHFLHLGTLDPEQFPLIATLILRLIAKGDRLKSFYDGAAVSIDGLGARRVAEALSDRPMTSPIAVSPARPVDTEQLGNDLTVRPVVDSDINHYLYSRNLPKNSQNMTLTADIKRAEHYNWWFDNRRRSYLVAKAGEPQLYIWDQMSEFEGRQWLVGGWFVCNDEVGFDIAMVALKWQLELTARDYPNATWIAIIKKTNNYVNLLNRYMGFTATDENDPAFLATAHFFNSPAPDEFNYVQLRNEV